MAMKNPEHPDEITAQWLTHVLGETGAVTRSKVVGLEKKILGEGKGLLSSVVRLGIEYDDKEEGAPDSLVVKIEPEGEDFRQVGEDLNAFEREIRFYREIAPGLNIRLPKVYYTVDEPPAYCMVMEDLSAYEPGDQLRGMHEWQVEDAVRKLAVVQAKYWNNKALDALEWMPTTNNISGDYNEKWDSFVEHYSYLAGKRGVELGARVGEHLGWIESEVDSRQKTLVHMDLREDNLLFGEQGTAESVIILDWQLAVRSMGAFDVARLMGGSELRSDRLGHPYDVLKAWYRKLVEEGVTGYTWEDALYDFRLGALMTLTFPVHFHVVMIDATGRTKDLGMAICRRLFSAAVDIEAGSILPG